MTETVRVRIAVAADHTGHWSAFGGNNLTDTEIKQNLFLVDLAEDEAYHWIEADVPIPTSTVIKGEVTE